MSSVVIIPSLPQSQTLSISPPLYLCGGGASVAYKAAKRKHSQPLTEKCESGPDVDSSSSPSPHHHNYIILPVC